MYRRIALFAILAIAGAATTQAQAQSDPLYLTTNPYLGTPVSRYDARVSPYSSYGALNPLHQRRGAASTARTGPISGGSTPTATIPSRWPTPTDATGLPTRRLRSTTPTVPTGRPTRPSRRGTPTLLHHPSSTTTNRDLGMR